MAEPVRAAITGIGHHVPPRCLTNHDLEHLVDTTDQWITERTGIRQRYVCDEHTATSDLAVEAAKKALRDAEVDAGELDLVLVATTTPDTNFPSTANLVQHRIGAGRAGACDVSCGCAGFVYALTLAAQGICSGLFKKVLVVGADVLSKIVDWTDRRTCVLFGDGAGAVVIEAAREGRGILTFSLRSDGSGGDLLRLPAGGSRKPCSQETVAQGLHYVHMNGSEVFKFAVKCISEATTDALRQAGFTVDDVDLFIPHQANSRIIDNASKRAGIPHHKVYVNVDRYGNTSCGSIPIALSEAVEQGRLDDGNLLVLCGFGAGLSWGAMTIRWSPTRSQRTRRAQASAAETQPDAKDAPAVQPV